MKKDLSIWFVLLIFNVLYYFRARIIPQGNFDTLGSRFFPLLLTFLLAAMLIIDIVNTLLIKKKGGYKKSEVSSSATKKELKKVIISGIMIVIYVMLMPFLGFLLTTIFYLLVQLWLLVPNKNMRGALTVISISVIASGAIFGVFEKILKIPLP